MKLRFNKILSVLFAAAFLSAQWIPVNADKLAVGSVEGLPEKLVVLDDKGNSVSDNGEYFFQVENMKAGETYTKKIQIMNLREDATYAIYFNAQPIDKSGEINLENECDCRIHMNDSLVYYGKVTGEGEPDIRDKALYLGDYNPGESRVMTVDITWVDAGNNGGAIDHGARVVDYNGTSVVREESGKKHIEGETTFKWIFTASVTESSTHTTSDDPIEVSDPSEQTSTVSYISNPDNPGGGNPVPQGPQNIIDFVKTGDTIMYVAVAVVAVATLFMAFLAFGKRRKNKNKDDSK